MGFRFHQVFNPLPNVSGHSLAFERGRPCEDRACHISSFCKRRGAHERCDVCDCLRGLLHIFLGGFQINMACLSNGTNHRTLRCRPTLPHRWDHASWHLSSLFAVRTTSAELLSELSTTKTGGVSELIRTLFRGSEYFPSSTIQTGLGRYD